MAMLLSARLALRRSLASSRGTALRRAVKDDSPPSIPHGPQAPSAARLLSSASGTLGSTETSPKSNKKHCMHCGSVIVADLEHGLQRNEELLRRMRERRQEENERMDEFSQVVTSSDQESRNFIKEKEELPNQIQKVSDARSERNGGLDDLRPGQKAMLVALSGVSLGFLLSIPVIGIVSGLV